MPHVNELAMADRIKELEVENKALWTAIESLDEGKCSRCERPAVDRLEHFQKWERVCPVCLAEWLTVLKPHKDEFIQTLDTKKYHKAWDAEFDKFFGKANNA